MAVEFIKIIKMVWIMLDNGEMIICMDMEFYANLMVINIKDYLKIVWNLEKVYWHFLINLSTKGILNKICFMDLANFTKKMEILIEVNTTWVNDKDQGNISKNIQSWKHIKDILKRIWNGDMEYTAGIQEVYIKDFSKRI